MYFHYVCIMFLEGIFNSDEISWKNVFRRAIFFMCSIYMHRCEGCADLAVACPVGASHQGTDDGFTGVGRLSQTSNVTERHAISFVYTNHGRYLFLQV